MELSLDHVNTPLLRTKFTYAYPLAVCINAQINAIKEQIRSTDYQIIKSYEYSLVGKETEYDIVALHTERQAQRDQINALQEQLLGM